MPAVERLAHPATSGGMVVAEELLDALEVAQVVLVAFSEHLIAALR